MRIIFLNSWYAKAGKAFFEFVAANASSADILALTEISPELFQKLKKTLSNFQGFYEEGRFDETVGFVYGQVTFFGRGIKFSKLAKLDKYSGLTFSLPFRVETGGKLFYLVSVHGNSYPGHKLDTPTRIRQSAEIAGFLKDKKGPKIIGGDFNLKPETKSTKMFEEAGYRNLIKEFKIKNTRNRLTWKQFPNEEKQYFADYVFVSPEVRVVGFSVPNVEASDHLPLILDFEV